MKILNPEGDAKPSTLTTEEFGRAMSRLDLSSIPPENRPAAIREHLARIMIGSIIDPETRHQLARASLIRNRR